MRIRHVLVLLSIALCHQRIARAQIITVERVGDKTITCMHSGLSSDLKDCGTRADWYSYVFVGSISTIASVGDDEKQLQIVPEEVFLGTPPILLTVLTSQADCLPDLKVGDRWLFYLRKEIGKPIGLDYYGNDSVPVGDAGEQIETLRRLKTIGNFAIVRGDVVRGSWSDREPVPNVKITATRASDGLQFASTTDANGNYEFQPFPPGDYKIIGDPAASFEFDENGVKTSAGACWRVTLSRSPHARIAGHVRRSNGTPVPGMELVLIHADGTQYVTDTTDPSGYFSFDSREPGEFVVGLNFPPRSDWFNGSGGGGSLNLPPASTFYPGGPDRSSASVIHLKADEKRDDIDFTIPVD